MPGHLAAPDQHSAGVEALKARLIYTGLCPSADSAERLLLRLAQMFRSCQARQGLPADDAAVAAYLNGWVLFMAPSSLQPPGQS